MSLADRIGPIMLPDLPLAACKGDLAFTTHRPAVRRQVCTGCPERDRCAFSSARGVHPSTVQPIDLHTSQRGVHPAGCRKVCTVCGKKYNGAARSKWCKRSCAQSVQCGTPCGPIAHWRHGEPACEKCQPFTSSRARKQQRGEAA